MSLRQSLVKRSRNLFWKGRSHGRADHQLQQRLGNLTKITADAENRKGNRRVAKRFRNALSNANPTDSEETSIPVEIPIRYDSSVAKAWAGWGASLAVPHLLLGSLSRSRSVCIPQAITTNSREAHDQSLRLSSVRLMPPNRRMGARSLQANLRYALSL
jgi:hypothetical protein